MAEFIRKFPRYDVSHASELGGTISESPVRLRLASLSFGGCGFFGSPPSDEFWPPKEVMCSIFCPGRDRAFQESRLLLGNLIYIRPVNTVVSASYFYGVKFHDEDRFKVRDLLDRLENLVKSGQIDRL
jgi:hypothetical protein